MAETYSDTYKDSSSLVAKRHRPPQGAIRDTISARPIDVIVPVSYGQHQSISILRLPEVIRRVGLKHAAIYQRITSGSFPKQISLGGRAVGWIESEINAWLQLRISARSEMRQIVAPAKAFLPRPKQPQDFYTP